MLIAAEKAAAAPHLPSRQLDQLAPPVVVPAVVPQAVLAELLLIKVVAVALE